MAGCVWCRGCGGGDRSGPRGAVVEGGATRMPLLPPRAFGRSVAPTLDDRPRLQEELSMAMMPLHSLDGHLFVEVDRALWLLDTGAPASFGARDGDARGRGVRCGRRLSRARCGDALALRRRRLRRPA